MKLLNTESKKLFRGTFVALLGLLSTSLVQAQTWTGDSYYAFGGGHDINWSATYNWSGQVSPTTGGNVVFGSGDYVTYFEQTNPYGGGYLYADTDFDYSVSLSSISVQSGVPQELVFYAPNTGETMSITGSGISVASGLTPQFYLKNQDAVNFQNSAVTNGMTYYITAGSQVTFFNSSSAGNSTIDNEGAGANGAGGYTFFENSATAGSATVTNGGGSGTNAGGGHTDFYSNSTAGSATFYNTGGYSNGFGGYMNFNDSSSAGSSAIYADGGQAGGAAVWFRNSSTAAQSTLSAQSYSGGGYGIFYFNDTSSGGTARLVGQGGAFDFSGLSNGGTTVGSIEGSGYFDLGSKGLTFGSLNTNTTVSATIQDGGSAGGTGGSLTKVGSGTTTLTAANTYSSNTSVSFGTLAVSGLGAAITSPNATVQTGVAGGDNGQLIISNGGSVADSFGLVAASAGSTGSVTVTGVNGSTASKWSNNQFYVGSYGNGRLIVQNGGQVTATTTAIGAFAGSNGNVWVDGSGSAFSTGSLAIGGSGSVLTISETAVVTVGGGTGALTLGGTSSSLFIGNGQTGGTLRAGSVNGTSSSASVSFGETDSSYTFAPNLTGSLSVNQSGTGTTILTGTNTYTGGTSVTTGKLLLQNSSTGSSAVTVASGATIGGTGTIGAAAISGTINAGSAGLTVAGNLLLYSSATLKFDLGTVNVNGNVSLGNANLVLNLAYGSTPVANGTELTLLSYSGTETGLFDYNGSSLLNGSTFIDGVNTFKINYLSGDPSIVLTSEDVVPEPSTWALMLGGLGLLAFWRREKREQPVR